MTTLSAPLAQSRPVAPWLIAVGGFLAMYVPSYWHAAQVLWPKEELSHGPIVLAVAVWLFWQARHQVLNAPSRPAPLLGGAVFAVGLLLYAFGRGLTVSSVDFTSQMFIVAGVLLLLQGPAALRAAWFPLLYLVFMVPLPSTLIDALTGPLKQWISYIVVDVLYQLGYPIARAGVTITIGPYQLLVADACSGLNSMFSLSALGALFMYIMGRRSRVHNAIMIASILPIAFAANIVRVVILVLVTYHLGDEAGQGFLHGAAGMVLMMVALVIFFALDVLLARVLGTGRKSGAASA